MSDYTDILIDGPDRARRRRRIRRKACRCVHPRGYVRGTLPHNIRFVHEFCQRCSGILSERQQASIIAEKLRQQQR